MKRRIVIVEDHTILRAGLRALLSSDPSLEVVGEADNGRDAILLAGEHTPDLMLMDLSMPGTGGIDATREIRQRYPDTRVIVLTVHKDEEYIMAALEAEANGYVLKDATQTELMGAVERVLAGKTYLSPDIADKVIHGFIHSRKNAEVTTRWDTVSQRERQVLKLIAEGHTNKSVASYLCISVKTVEKHRANLMKKLGLHNISGLTAFAMQKGLVGQ